MAYDHGEQEQLDALKAWWKQYGNVATWILILVLLSFSAWKGWGLYQSKQSMQASLLYEAIENAIKSNDQAKAQSALSEIQNKYAKTDYASMASLLAAKNLFLQTNLKGSQEQLIWVVNNTKSPELKSLAKIRLAGIFLDIKSFDEALKQLSGEFPKELNANVADRKGDILVAQNKIDEARLAYQSALDLSSNKNPNKQLIQLKLDALGGSPAKVANK